MATEILGDIDPIMRANCYPRMPHIVCNAGIESLVRKLAQHGATNDVNKQLEYAGKKFHYTNNVTNEVSQNGTFFAVEDGNVGVLTRVDREALRRTRANFHEWDVVRLPMIDLPVGSHYYTSVGDQSATVGAATEDLTCAVKEYFGFSVDVAFWLLITMTQKMLQIRLSKRRLQHVTKTNLWVCLYMLPTPQHFPPEVRAHNAGA